MSKINKYLEQNVVFIPAVVSYFLKDEKVLLGLRKKVSSGLGEGIVSGIGGKIGDSEEFRNETSDEALLREVREEVCVEVTNFRKMGRVRFININKPKWNMDVVVYVVDGWEGEPAETEVMKPLWFDVNDLPRQRMWKDNLYWVPKVLAGEIVDVVFLFGEDGEMLEYEFR